MTWPEERTFWANEETAVFDANWNFLVDRCVRFLSAWGPLLLVSAYGRWPKKAEAVVLFGIRLLFLASED